MNRRALLSLLPLAVLPASCQLRFEVNVGGRTNRIVHVVCVWLKNPRDEAARKRILEAAEKFRSIPGLLTLRKGECLPSKRPIVDSTYDLAFLMEFASIEDMNRYLEHPVHKDAAKTILQPLAKKIVVYDFRDR